MKISNHLLLNLLCLFNRLILVASEGLIGFGLGFYDPLCGYACKNSLLLPLNCSDAKVPYNILLDHSSLPESY